MDSSNSLWQYALAPGTAKPYKYALQRFLQFLVLSGSCKYASQEILPPITEDILINFITFCAEILHIQSSTINVYLAGIRFHYIKAGLKFHSSSWERLPYIQKAIKRKQGQGASKHLPITFSVLYNICALLEKSVYSPHTDVMLLSAFKLAFFGFSRCGEVTIKSHNELDKAIRISDIVFSANKSSYVLYLRASKTDPYRKGVHIPIFANEKLCPVSSMFQFVQMRISQGAYVSDPLFVDFNGTVLTRHQFISYLHHLLCHLGVDTNKYSGHSFCIGAATAAASAGIEDHVIQSLGRWVSNCYTRYIRADPSILRKAQSGKYVGKYKFRIILIVFIVLL